MHFCWRRFSVVTWRRFSRRSRTARGARRRRRMRRSVSGGGAGRYLPVRSRCLHPGQQQGRRWPSSSSSWVLRMRRSRVISCLASSTQQMNSFRASGVMSFQASSAAGLAITQVCGKLVRCPTWYSLAAHRATVAVRGQPDSPTQRHRSIAGASRYQREQVADGRDPTGAVTGMIDRLTRAGYVPLAARSWSAVMPAGPPGRWPGRPALLAPS